MLARSYKTADELGIREVERDALISILHQIERGDIKIVTEHRSCMRFDAQLGTIHMNKWFSTGWSFGNETATCGTVGCLAGTAFIQTNGEAFPELRLHFNFTNTRQRASEVIEETRFAAAIRNDRFLIDRLPTALGILFMNYGAHPDNVEKNLRSFLTTGNLDVEASLP